MVDLLSLQKKFILPHLHEGDTAVDFTMGNGYDTVFLSKTVGEGGKSMRSTYRSPRSSQRSTISKKTAAPTTGISSAHPTTERPEFVGGKIKAGMFNLGYLPGSGHKQLTTKRTTTLPAVKNAMEMLGEDAILCVAVYPGHPEGALEGKELTEYFSTVSRFKYSIAQIRMVNSPESPFFTIIETK